MSLQYRMLRFALWIVFSLLLLALAGYLEWRGQRAGAVLIAAFDAISFIPISGKKRPGP